MLPDELDSHSLYLFVFGPGKGESIAIRIPPDKWIVIDSCNVAGQPAAMHVLPKYGGRCECVVLTHRHQDHYAGFSGVVAYDDWRIIACNDLYLDKDLDESRDVEARVSNELEQVFSVIDERWENDADSVWWTWRRSLRHVGEAELLVLHPEEEFAREYAGDDRNELSSAVLLSWHDTRLLLGADVPNPHWAEICGVFSDRQVNEHQMMKVPHHGSDEALDDGFLEGDATRTWLITPYNSKRVPSFEDGRGTHRMLQHVDTLYLTGLPRAHNRQMAQPCDATRQKLAAGDDPVSMPFSLPGGIQGSVEPVREDLSCYFVARLEQTGQCNIIGYGPGSLRVTEER